MPEAEVQTRSLRAAIQLVNGLDSSEKSANEPAAQRSNYCTNLAVCVAKGPSLMFGTTYDSYKSDKISWASVNLFWGGGPQ